MKHTTLSPKGAKIVAALSEFRDTLKTGVRVEDRFTVRTVELDLVPHDYAPEEVKQVRDLLGLSQPLFARFLGVGVKTIRSWEQGGRTLSPMAARFLDEIKTNPDYWRGRFRQMISTKGKQEADSRSTA